MMTEEQKKLAEENIKLVYKYIYSHNLPFEEYVGVLSETLCKCAIRYNPSKGFSFSTLLYYAFDNIVKVQHRKKNALKVIPEYLITSGYEIMFDDASGRPITLFDMVADGSDRIEDMLFLNAFHKFLDGLKECDKKILMLRISGMTDAEIGEEIGTSQSMVCRVRNRIGKRIKEEICGTS